MRPFAALALFSVLALVSFGCATSEPYCSAVVDATGRAVAACGNPRQDPVCNLPGEEAHFEERAMGVTLVGALRASCDGDDNILCPAGTEGPAFCITDPEL